MIGLAILNTNHWQIGVASGQVYRLDRWTGKVVACNAMRADEGNLAMFVGGSDIPCERR